MGVWSARASGNVMGLWRPKSIGKGFATGGAVLLALIVAAVLLLHHFWPFTEAAVKRELGDAASASVTFTKFHDKYFPPGCVAEGVTFQRNSSGPPLITIRRLTIRRSEEHTSELQSQSN